MRQTFKKSAILAPVRAAILALAAGGALGATGLPAAADGYRDTASPITVVTNLDLDRYLGKWYEIARFPNRFERGCAGVTAEYSLRDDGDIRVLNTCHEGSPDGPIDTIEGVAEVVGPGKLSVNFVPWLPFAAGDYWVLWIDRAYSIAVVGNPDGNTGWVLARSPEVAGADYARALEALERSGYDTDQIMLVAQ